MKRFTNSFDKTKGVITQLEKWGGFFIVLAATCMMLGILLLIGGFQKPVYFYFSAGSIVLGIISFFIEALLNFMSVLIINLYNISTVDFKVNNETK